MSFPVSQIITYVLPPFLGAIIGYVTNALAIKMLFRPLTEKRFLGIRLPFTPGIIPKKRHDLAHSIGTMVSRELITESIIQERLAREDFEKSIYSQVSGFTANLLDTPVGNILLPGDEKEDNGIRQLLISVFNDITESGAFKSLVTTFVRDILTDLAAKPLSAIIGPPSTIQEKVRNIISRLFSEQNRTAIRNALSEAEVLNSKKLNKDVQDAVFGMTYSLYPSLLSSMIRWLERDDTRKTLEVQGRKLVKSIVDRLSGLQRLFITAGKFDKKIEENLPFIVDDIIDAVKKTGNDEVTRKNLCASLSGGLFQSGSPVGNTPSSYSSVSSALLEEGTNLLGKPALQSRMAELVVKYLGKREALPIRSILADILKKPEENLVHEMADTLVAALFSSKSMAGENIGDLFKRILVPFREFTVGELLGLPGHRKGEIDSYATGKIVELLREKIPRLVESFNIYQLVVDRINGLNIESVEKLLLIVIEKHLKWINIFGGILGALIGTLQVILRIFF